MTKFKVITTYVYAFNVTRHALNAQDIYVAEKMRMTKAWQVGPDNLETVGSNGEVLPRRGGPQGGPRGLGGPDTGRS